MGKLSVIISLIVFVIVGINAYADIYKYVDENGITHFTNIPSGKEYKKIMSEGTLSVQGKPRKNKNLNSPKKHYDYHEIIHSTSKKYNVEPSLVKAVIKVESDGNATAISKKGAMGLMQLMPLTAKDMDVKNPFDPVENIEGGIKYLRFLLDKFDGDLKLALAAYNAGPTKVEESNGIPRIEETQRYVKKVLSLYNSNGSGRASTVIYKVIYSDGTVLYTNTPIHYEGSRLSRF